jgi:hypothetical protein
MYGQIKSLALAIVLTAAVAGCGGGGADAEAPDVSAGSGSPTDSAAGPDAGSAQDPAPDSVAESAAGPAEGLWTGSTSTNRAVMGLVLSDGTYYLVYTQAADGASIAGVVQGSGAVSGATFSSSNARDFSIEDLEMLPVTVSATAAAKQSFNGVITYGSGGSAAFSTSYDVDYDATPSPGLLAGTYTGQVASFLGVQNAALTVSSAGDIAGAAAGCSFTGSATPRAHGNAFDVTIDFGPAPCPSANQSFSGMAYFRAATKVLYIAAPNAARTDGVIFVGVKP